MYPVIRVSNIYFCTVETYYRRQVTSIIFRLLRRRHGFLELLTVVELMPFRFDFQQECCKFRILKEKIQNMG